MSKGNTHDINSILCIKHISTQLQFITPTLLLELSKDKIREMINFLVPIEYENANRQRYLRHALKRKYITSQANYESELQAVHLLRNDFDFFNSYYDISRIIDTEMTIINSYT